MLGSCHENVGAAMIRVRAPAHALEPEKVHNGRLIGASRVDTAAAMELGVIQVSSRTIEALHAYAHSGGVTVGQ